MQFIKIIFFSLLFGYQLPSIANISNYFAQVKTDPNALYIFLKTMPKGGELHYHLAGGAYPETMLALAAKGDYCLDKESLAISKTIERCLGIKAHELNKQPLLYDQTIRAWSMKDFFPSQKLMQDHFFASFYKFMPIVAAYRPQLLAEIMQRAANQHEQYLEIMILPDNAQATNFANETFSLGNLGMMQQKLLANKDFQDNIHYTVSETQQLLPKSRQILGCDKDPHQSVCQLTVKFQYYILREQPLEKVFAQALNGFAAAASSQDIVGVNLVQAEDGIIALRDYHQHMQIFSFLHQHYPQVHIALHAGELAADTTPEALGFHVNEAIQIGKAERIGHGVDIAFETNAPAILKQMADKKIAVEINLISNKKILNIFGKKHPLIYYLTHQVPVVLSSDDEGVLRTDLTRQYVEAVLHHAVGYSTLKMINRNALTYSFLPGKSLWTDAAKAEPVKACQTLNSASCLQFIKENEKARLQWQLENKLTAFEKTYT